MSRSARRIVYALLHLAPPLAIPGATMVLFRHGLLAGGEADWGQVFYTAMAAGILASAYLAIGRIQALGREWDLTPVSRRSRRVSRARTTEAL